jgi:hypothetical protein
MTDELKEGSLAQDMFQVLELPEMYGELTAVKLLLGGLLSDLQKKQVLTKEEIDNIINRASENMRTCFDDLAEKQPSRGKNVKTMAEHGLMILDKYRQLTATSDDAPSSK